MHGTRRTAAGRPAADLALAVVAAGFAVVLAVVRSRRTGVEVGLIALSLALFGLGNLAGVRRRVLRAAGWLALLAVVVIAVEPHLH